MFRNHLQPVARLLPMIAQDERRVAVALRFFADASHDLASGGYLLCQPQGNLGSSPGGENTNPSHPDFLRFSSNQSFTTEVSGNIERATNPFSLSVQGGFGLSQDLISKEVV